MIQITVKGLTFEVVDPRMHKLISFDKITLRNVYTSMIELCGYNEDEELRTLDTVQLRCRIIALLLHCCDYPYSHLTIDSILFDTERRDIVITPAAVLAQLK